MGKAKPRVPSGYNLRPRKGAVEKKGKGHKKRPAAKKRAQVNKALGKQEIVGNRGRNWDKRRDEEEHESRSQSPPSPQAQSPPLPLLIATRSISNCSINDAYHPTERIPRASFDDLVGMDDILELVRWAAVAPMANAKVSKILLEDDIPKGMLLTGKPGTGKTTLADAVVTELRKYNPRWRYFQETGSCLSKWVGESEKHLRDVFRVARENSPAVIFLDELDGLAKRREADSNACNSTMITTLLQEINNVEPGKVFLIAATNCPKFVDPAVIRRGRFDIVVDIPAPNEEARTQIFQRYLDKREMTFSEDELVEAVGATQGFTGCEIKNAVNQVYQAGIKRAFPTFEDWCRTTPRSLLPRLEEIQRVPSGKFMEVINQMKATSLKMQHAVEVSEE